MVWVVSGATDLATRVDPKTGLSTTIEVGDGPAGIVVVDGAVWIANGDGTVSRVDATTGRLVRTIEVGVPLEGIATGSGSVWVSAPA
jgi:streptogramin lyase